MELSLKTVTDFLTTDFAIDMAINVAGYIIAGTIGILVYRLIHRTGSSQATVAEEAPTADQAKSPIQTKASLPAANRVQFIRFGESETRATSQQRSSALSSEKTVNRRNRSEIIRVARGMLKAGATHENIRKVLPISEAELSLLSTNNS